MSPGKQNQTFFVLTTMGRYLRLWLPGIILLLCFLVLGTVVHKDYGIAWDESMQRHTGEVSWDYVLHHDPALFTYQDRQYGVGFELPLIVLEKVLGIHDAGNVYRMRHLVTHFFFLAGAFFLYLLALRLYRSHLVACLGFLCFVSSPRLYAHSFFNSKDIPYLAMFTITLYVAQVAFQKKTNRMFAALGLVCGYLLSLRVMGVLPIGFFGFFLALDLFFNRKDPSERNKVLIRALYFLLPCGAATYLFWPYLWPDPLQHFLQAYQRMSHFDWPFSVLLNGKSVPGTGLPWYYLPTWFLITNPEVWLIAGLGGLMLTGFGFLRHPLRYLQNTPERNFLLYIMCFGASILAVILLHAVIYDDWRHLYFIYAPFVLLALYFIHRLLQTRARRVVQVACLAQCLASGYFMVSAHPFQQVYFNAFVSHDKEFLRRHYELDYWGVCYKQGMDHLAATHPRGNIRVSSYPLGVYLARFNAQLLPENERSRFIYTTPDSADYFLTNFRWHPEDYNYPETDFSVEVLHSTIFCVYETHR